jgi:hypothetical protein
MKSDWKKRTTKSSQTRRRGRQHEVRLKEEDKMEEEGDIKSDWKTHEDRLDEQDNTKSDWKRT